jgi:hypothetical protein
MTFKWLYFTQVMLNLDSEILIQSLNWIFLMFGLGGGGGEGEGFSFSQCLAGSFRLWKTLQL